MGQENSFSAIATPNNGAPVAFAFTRFRVLPHRRELLADGVPVNLPGRAFDILMALVRASGNLVTKDQLLSAAWPNVVVEENALQVQISALRKALGGDRNAIRTVSGRGYCFCAKVATVDADGPDGLPPQPAVESAPAVASTRSNLPAFVSELIGREPDIEELRSLAATHRLVTLTGPGGVGKTRLGLELARQMLPDIAEGVWLAELASVCDHAAAVAAVAAALGLEPDNAGELPEAGLRARGQRHRLLILDNCEHVIDSAAAIVETLLRAGPGLRLLVTSREPLRVEGEQVYRVPSLGVPPQGASDPDEVLRHAAARLFVARAHAADTRFSFDRRTAALVGEICRRLDGVPLAIELAAAQAAMVGVAECAARLDDGFQLLAAGRRTTPRHQSLRATFDWSHRLLGEAERMVLRRLAAFGDSFTLDEANAVVADRAMSASELANRIADLVAKSLVMADIGGPVVRYRLFATTRLNVLEKLAESGELPMVVPGLAGRGRHGREQARAA
jgi:predicted ATPase/DNA-binding winged helix-turn-helix (wHTH) protein